MSDDFRGSDKVGESNSASRQSPINASLLFEEQAAAKNIPKEATQQLGSTENQGQSILKEPPLSQPENAQGQAPRNDVPWRPRPAEGNVTRNEAPVGPAPKNAEGQLTRTEAPVPPRAEGYGTRVDAPVRNVDGEITRNDQPWQTRQGLARDGDRTRPVSPIDLSPNPYGSGVQWGPARDISPFMKGPKFTPDATDSRPANRPSSTPPRPTPFSPVDLGPTPGPRPGTPGYQFK